MREGEGGDVFEVGEFSGEGGERVVRERNSVKRSKTGGVNSL